MKLFLNRIDKYGQVVSCLPTRNLVRNTQFWFPKLLLTYLFSGLFLFVGSTTVVANDLTIKALQTEFIATPGKVVNTFIQIKNNSQQIQKLKPFLQIPEGWQLFSDKKIITLPAGGEKSILLSFQIAPNALAEDFQLNYSLQSLTDTKINQKCTLTISVEKIIKVLLEPVEAPKYVNAGAAFYAKFVLRNFGNTVQRINLKAHYCEIEEGQASFVLAPQKSQVITVKATTLEAVTSISRKTIRLEAMLEGTEIIPYNAYQHITVLPNASKETSYDRQLPGYLNLTWLNRKSGANAFEQRLQGTLFFKGSFDEAKTQNFELKARGPNRYDHATLGLYDEYYASLKMPHFSAFIGDKTYRLSTLTEFSRYARGAEFVQTRGKLDVGLFYFRPRFYQGTKEGYAVWAKYQLKHNNHIGLNFFKKQSPLATQSALLYSAEMGVKPLPRTRLEAEYALGMEGDRKGNALFLSLNTNPFARLHLFSRWVYASKYYPGYFSDAMILSGSMNYQLNGKISLSASYNQDEANIARDTLFGIAPFSKSYQAAINVQLAEKSRFKVQARFQTLKDRQSDLKFFNEEQIIRLSYFQQVKQLQFTINGEYGQSSNFLNEPSEQAATVFRSFLELTWKIGEQHTIRGFCQFFDQNSFSQFKEKQLIYGLSANFQLSQQTQFFFQYQSNYQLKEYYRDRNLLQFNLTQNIGRKHSLSFISRYALLQNTVHRKDWISSLQYNWNFGIPIKSKASENDIYGKIISSGMDKLAGILLQLNGQTVATDERGHFKFKALPPGEYYLLIDKSTLGVHRIPDVPLPLKISVEADKPTQIVFGLIKGVKVYGKLDLEAVERKFISFSKNKTAFNPVLVEISNGKETYRQLTDEFATFAFTDLRPGKWTLKVIKNESHQPFSFEKEHFSIKLLPGGEQQVLVKVLPKERKIQFQQGKTLSLKPKE